MNQLTRRFSLRKLLTLSVEFDYDTLGFLWNMVAEKFLVLKKADFEYSWPIWLFDIKAVAWSQLYKLFTACNEWSDQLFIRMYDSYLRIQVYRTGALGKELEKKVRELKRKFFDIILEFFYNMYYCISSYFQTCIIVSLIFFNYALLYQRYYSIMYFYINGFCQHI